MLNSEVRKKIFQIVNDLESTKIESISLMSGYSGLPLLYSALYDLESDPNFLKKINTSLNRLIEELNNRDDYGVSYCNGLTGSAFMMEILMKKNLVRKDLQNDIDENLNFIDDLVLEYALNNTNSFEEIDFLHGALGVLHYCLERTIRNKKLINDRRIILLIEKICLFIQQNISEVDKFKYFRDVTDESPKFNCGLAHGHVSYILIFTNFLKIFGHNILVHKTLLSSINYILRFESKNQDTFSQFPGILTNHYDAKYNIPLGWCYGDQTISFSLLKASEYLNDNSLKLKAESIALKTVEREEINQIFPFGAFDCGFCHGLSSIAYMHKKWYLISGKEVFQKSYLKFIENILNESTSAGIGGYQKIINYGKYEDRAGLLDGSIGIGIVLCDYLLEKNKNEWDKLFLLN